VALFEGRATLAHRCEVIGRGHAERLVPMIAELPGKGQAERILVSLGPGSFTGVRIGLAAARALGIAWDAEVLGYPTMALVAAMARHQHGDSPLTVCMTGGHGEWFVQNFGADGLPQDNCRSQSPQLARRDARYAFAAGSKAADLLHPCGPESVALDILPDARHALGVPPALITENLAPLYGRSPDAKLPQARR